MIHVCLAYLVTFKNIHGFTLKAANMDRSIFLSKKWYLRNLNSQMYCNFIAQGEPIKFSNFKKINYKHEMIFYSTDILSGLFKYTLVE